MSTKLDYSDHVVRVEKHGKYSKLHAVMISNEHSKIAINPDWGWFYQSLDDWLDTKEVVEMVLYNEWEWSKDWAYFRHTVSWATGADEEFRQESFWMLQKLCCMPDPTLKGFLVIPESYCPDLSSYNLEILQPREKFWDQYYNQASNIHPTISSPYYEKNKYIF